MNVDPLFWQDQKKSTKILREKKDLEDSFALVEDVQKNMDDSWLLLDFAEQGDADSETEAEVLITKLETQVNDLEIQRLLSQEADKLSALIQVNAGAGGTEACDWALMIFRMLLRFCEKKNWKVEIQDELSGDTAGIRNATFIVEGDYAYGLLKSEIGVHRLVRISPFDSNARRHTSFCSVFVSPIVDESIDIDLKESDIRVDTYRASGAGGQHVNRTESAVRMTHVPTGIVVACQTQRSQIQNRESCMQMLRAKLYDLELQKRKAGLQSIEDGKMDNAFGSQIRSYVMHPYKLVKDTRTLHQDSDPNRVLDGTIDSFSYEYLRQSASGSFKGKGMSAEDDDL